MQTAELLRLIKTQLKKIKSLVILSSLQQAEKP